LFYLHPAVQECKTCCLLVRLGEVMPLTPEDVSNKRFTPVRLREGYDMGEVDQFLDEVEAELGRLIKENDELRSKLQAAQKGGAAVPAPTPTPVQEEKKPEPEPVAPPAPVAAPVAPAAPTELKVTTVGEASTAAARLLEIATNNADQIVTEAKEEADQIIGAARTKSERLESETKAKTDRLESDARTRASMLDSETESKRRELLGNLDREKGQITEEIDKLRAFEREYRSRLKGYFTQQLAALDGIGSGDSGTDLAAGGSSDGPAPKRLRSILGEEDNG
jgi:DivIVA domain-containing protein